MHTLCIIPWIIDRARVCVCHTVCMEMTSTKIAHMATQLKILYHNILKEIESEKGGVKLKGFAVTEPSRVSRCYASCQAISCHACYE